MEDTALAILFALCPIVAINLLFALGFWLVAAGRRRQKKGLITGGLTVFLLTQAILLPSQVGILIGGLLGGLMAILFMAFSGGSGLDLMGIILAPGAFAFVVGWYGLSAIWAQLVRSQLVRSGNLWIKQSSLMDWITVMQIAVLVLIIPRYLEFFLRPDVRWRVGHMFFPQYDFWVGPEHVIQKSITGILLLTFSFILAYLGRRWERPAFRRGAWVILGLFCVWLWFLVAMIRG